MERIMIFYILLLLASVSHITNSAQEAHTRPVYFVYEPPQKATLLASLLRVPDMPRALIDIIHAYAHDTEFDVILDQEIRDALKPNPHVAKEINGFIFIQELPLLVLGYIGNDLPIRVESIKAILEQGPSQQAINRALLNIVSCYAANTDICIRLLLEYGAQPDCTNINGDTPLILAVRHGNPDNLCAIADILLQFGAKPAITNMQHESFISLKNKLVLDPSIKQELNRICEHHARKRAH
jgi:hypothetical protein